MKSKIAYVILVVALCASAFAGIVTDSANVFGPRTKEVAAALETLPVWIETRVAPPAEGLKAYADAKAQETTQRGFYVVITTQPREWRVSMNPVGLASSESVRLAGEQMVARFKRGEFGSGAITLARELNRLANPPQVVNQPARQSGAVTKAWADLEAQKKAAKAKADEAAAFWMWMTIGAVALAVVTIWIVWALNRRAARLEREREQRWNARQATFTKSAPAAPTQPTAEEARRVFDSYTPEQRRTIIEERHHHHYSSGAMTDPVMFYLLMNAATQPHYYPAPAPYYDPAPRHHHAPDPTPSPSYDPPERRESSSDSSWSSPSSDFGGGGSSFDSGGSSSDSSGGGGSW